MKILYVISTLGGGGAESQLCSFASYLKDTHPECDFEICAIKAGGVLENRLIEKNIKYSVLGISGLFKSIIALRKLLKKNNYDIVHAHMFFSDIVCRFALIGKRTKLVSTHHGLGKWKKKYLILLDKISKGLVDRFVMVSEQSYQIRLNREKYPAKRMIVIYNGVSDRFLTASSKSVNLNEKIIIGTIARMTDNKQIDLMIRAMKDLKEYKNLYFEIVGDGENYEKLVQLAKDFGVDAKVRFWGWQDDVLPIIEKWQIFSLTSVFEDLPVSMIECMAQGIVPIASSVGGIMTLIGNNVNGILCDSSKYETFVDAVKFLINNPRKYEELSANCTKTVKENFIINSNVEKTISLYKNLRNE